MEQRSRVLMREKRCRSARRAGVASTSVFYLGISFIPNNARREASQLAVEAAYKMKPIPKDEKKPLTAMQVPTT